MSTLLVLRTTTRATSPGCQWVPCWYWELLQEPLLLGANEYPAGTENYYKSHFSWVPMSTLLVLRTTTRATSPGCQWVPCWYWELLQEPLLLGANEYPAGTENYYKSHFSWVPMSTLLVLRTTTRATSPGCQWVPCWYWELLQEPLLLGANEYPAGTKNYYKSHFSWVPMSTLLVLRTTTRATSPGCQWVPCWYWELLQEPLLLGANEYPAGTENYYKSHFSWVPMSTLLVLRTTTRATSPGCQWVPCWYWEPLQEPLLLGANEYPAGTETLIILNNYINTTAANALAPCITRTSAANEAP